MRSRLARGTTFALLPAFALLVLTACGGSAGSSGGSSASSSAVSTPAGTSSTPAADLTIDVTIAGGKVTPSGKTFKVSAGQTILINVTSDAEDEVHVHGYDKELPVTAGKPASVSFKADVKGTFEIETHESGKLIGKLIVS